MKRNPPNLPTPAPAIVSGRKPPGEEEAVSFGSRSAKRSWNHSHFLWPLPETQPMQRGEKYSSFSLLHTLQPNTRASHWSKPVRNQLTGGLGNAACCRAERGQREQGWSQHGTLALVFCTPPAEDLACNPGMCPDCKSSQRPFSLHLIH